MIKRIFWDIDETLIHTSCTPFEDGCKHHQFELDSQSYYTIIRPCSNALIEFSRKLVGADNVYVLTTATRDYARTINQIAGWNFLHQNIFSREDLNKHRIHTAYGGYVTLSVKDIADSKNVLIDNLYPIDNINKMNFIGINNSRYMKIPDYYGVEYSNCTFVKDVEEFLLKLHNNE